MKTLHDYLSLPFGEIGNDIADDVVLSTNNSCCNILQSRGFNDLNDAFIPFGTYLDSRLMAYVSTVGQLSTLLVNAIVELKQITQTP